MVIFDLAVKPDSEQLCCLGGGLPVARLTVPRANARRMAQQISHTILTVDFRFDAHYADAFNCQISLADTACDPVFPTMRVSVRRLMGIIYTITVTIFMVTIGDAMSVCDDIPDACVPASELGSCKCALVLTEDSSLDKKGIRQVVLSPTAARNIRPLVPQSNQPILTEMPPGIERSASKTFYKIALVPKHKAAEFATFYSEKCTDTEESLFTYCLRALSQATGCSVEKPCEFKLENRVKTPTPPLPVPFNLDAKRRNPHKYDPEKHKDKYGDNQLPLQFYSFYGKMADNYLGMTLISFVYTKSTIKTMRLTQQSYQNCKTVGLLLGRRQKCATEYHDIYAKYDESVEKRFLAKIASDANKKVVWKEHSLLNMHNTVDLDITYCPDSLS